MLSDEQISEASVMQRCVNGSYDAGHRRVGAVVPFCISLHESDLSSKDSESC